jgi:DNA-binding IclR family transcriptional regulator
VVVIVGGHIVTLPAPSFNGRMTELSERRPAPVNAAGRLLAVLDAFGPGSLSLSLSDIARRSGLSLSTAHRLVRELAEWGALERDAGGRYAIGVRLLELAALAPRGLALREAAFPALDDLRHRTRGAVHLGVLEGTKVVYVEAIRARAARPSGGRAGDRLPVHASGVGLVLLAHAPPEFQERILAGPLERFTPLTVTDPAELRRRLDQVRRQGYAVAAGQLALPDVMVAAPVRNPAGAVVAAVSVIAESSRARARVLAGMLAGASAEITRRLAAPA